LEVENGHEVHSRSVSLTYTKTWGKMLMMTKIIIFTGKLSIIKLCFLYHLAHFWEILNERIQETFGIMQPYLNQSIHHLASSLC